MRDYFYVQVIFQGVVWWVIRNAGSYDRPVYHLSRDRCRAGSYAGAWSTVDRLRALVGDLARVAPVKVS